MLLTPMITVKLSDLLDGLDFASFDEGFEAGAYVCRETGTVYCVAEDAGVEMDVPPDLETSEQYVAMPSKRDLDLGVRLVMAFVEEVLPEDLETVEGYFNKRGAYSKFRDLLARRDVLDRWHAFEAEATARALREWAECEGFSVVEN
jgi:hypothetical protein